MKNILFLLLILISMAACDDGDVIVTTFDFDSDTQLQACRDDQNFDSNGNPIPETDRNIDLLYTINTEPNETLSLSLNQEFTGKFEGLTDMDTLSIDLNSSNKITYRTYNGAVNNQYFCADVPPSDPRVVEEYTTTNGGTVLLYTSIIAQDDGDGVEAELEDLNGNGNYFDDDSDGDGIPNFLDTDDDNDNVLTQAEIEVSASFVDENDFPDTDGDGISNYLDEDDDDDGVISRYEDLNANDELDDEGNPILNPQDDDTNGDNIPNYLDPETAEEEVIDLYRQNIISRTFKTRVVAKNITMKSSYNDEEIILETLVLGYLEVNSNNEIITPEED